MLRNTIPWLIAACAGSVIIAAYFVPTAQGWQDTIGQWFEVLAAFAFVLGGVNLAMQNLQKISSREPGWGYAAITLFSFLVTLGVGLFKVGVPADASGSRWGGSYQAEGSAFWWLYEYAYNPTRRRSSPCWRSTSPRPRSGRSAGKTPRLHCCWGRRLLCSWDAPMPGPC